MPLPWNVTPRPWKIVSSDAVRGTDHLVKIVAGSRNQFTVAEGLRRADAETIVQAITAFEKQTSGTGL